MLYEKLKNYTIEDAIKFEEKDRQFLALKRLYQNKKFSDELYLFLIIANALISFQLSWKGEDYWEEFSINWEWKMKNGELNVVDIYSFFEDLLRNGKNNRRFVDMKLKRLQKILSEDFQKIVGYENNLIDWNKENNITSLIDVWLVWWEFYYKSMDKLAEDLAKIMNQKKDAKTIVFAVKMFSYWARNVFWYLEKFPFDLMIPVDSRLENLYKKYNWAWTKKEIKDYYINLSKKLNIPPLHLDAILWVDYERFIK